MKYKITYKPQTKRFCLYTKEHFFEVWFFEVSFETLKEAEEHAKYLAQKEITIKHGRI